MDDSHGAWELPEDLRMLQQTVRRFMQQEVKPEEDKLPHDAIEMPPDVLKRLQAKARGLGLWQMQTPGEWGGAGLNLLGQAVVAEEASQCRMGLYIHAAHSFGWDLPVSIFKGTKAQIEKYAVPVIESGEKTFVAITEPSGGSDPGRAIAARAVRTGSQRHPEARRALNKGKIGP